MASTSLACKRAARFLPSIFSSILLISCGGPTKLPIDLDKPARGTDRQQMRALMAQEKSIFFETRDGERFYGEVRRTSGDRFELSKKDPFEGETLVPMSQTMIYLYVDIARAQLAPEEGNSTRGYVLFMSFFVVAILVMGALFVASGGYGA